MSTKTPEIARSYHGRPLPLPGTYELDRSHSSIEFVSRHLMITKVRGRFSDFEGRIHIDEVPVRSWAEGTVDVGSLDTADERRDAHLRSPDFFDVERFPTMSFRSTRVEPAGDGSWKVHGELTIRDLTRPITFEVQFEGATSDPWGGQRIGFSATAEVDREEWGLTWNQVLEGGGLLVGPKVRIEVSVQAVLV
ncbi:MAG: YceI family protein [Actinomycetota bacterium]|nr:YceI family protein [Actinomycetota bacterium]